MARMRRSRLLAVAGLGYLAGTLPSADLACRAVGAGPIRTMGTGNPGAVNAIRQLGARWGYAVLAADIAKGAAASAVGRAIGGDVGSHIGGCAAVAGHCYPVWNGFRGGKGVAASVGQCFVTFPAYFGPDLALAGLTGALPWWKQRAYTATVVSATAWTAAATLWWRRGWPNLWGPSPSPALPLAAATTSAMILERFHAAGRAEPVTFEQPEGTDIIDELETIA
jgi:glycerol-3-phosphate acyltransferase PlsY